MRSAGTSRVCPTATAARPPGERARQRCRRRLGEPGAVSEPDVVSIAVILGVVLLIADVSVVAVVLGAVLVIAGVPVGGFGSSKRVV